MPWPLSGGRNLPDQVTWSIWLGVGGTPGSFAAPAALPHAKLLRAIETIGTVIAPAVRTPSAAAA
jgi:hypothetical protein